MQQAQCDLKLQINGEHTFLFNQKTMVTFSGRLRRMMKRTRNPASDLVIMDFPCGPDGFELVARFCYNNGRIAITPSNICVLHSSAVFMEMTEEFVPCNLLSQAETFLNGLFYWTWDEILTSIKNCEQFFDSADSSGVLHRLVSSLLAKILVSSETPLIGPSMFTAYSTSSSSSPSPSPDTFGFSFSPATKTPDTMIRPSPSSLAAKECWFDDLIIFHPKIITKIMTTLNAYGSDNKNLTLTRFLLHYLNKAAHGGDVSRADYGGLADTAVHGVVVIGEKAFSCRGLFWVLRVVSNLGLSKDCRQKLEYFMGTKLDKATLDDLLVSGHGGGVYDVSLVLRLVKIFVSSREGTQVASPGMKKVGRLLDKYLGEISPDQSLKVTKFLTLAESLPDSARDSFDGVYRAMDIYLESHPTLSLEDRSRLCRCLNYEKLSCEASRDLAKNPRIPPRAAVQALLVSQGNNVHPGRETLDELGGGFPWPTESRRMSVYYKGTTTKREFASPTASMEKEELRLNLQKMQMKVVELEKTCREMKGKMSMMAKNETFEGNCLPSSHRHHSRHHVHRNTSRGLPKLC